MQGLCNDSCNYMKRGQTKGHTVCIFKFMRKSILIYCIYIYIYIYMFRTNALPVSGYVTGYSDY